MKDKMIKRYLNINHLNQYSWLVYSPAMNGLFCKYCSLFPPTVLGHANFKNESGILVTKALISFKNLLGKDGMLEKHQKCKYHFNSIQAAKDFLNCY